MLYYAHLADSNEHQGSKLLTLVILTRNVRKIKSGVHRYDPSNHAVWSASHSPSEKEIAELFVQSELADAPVLIWIVGDLSAACASRGARGYGEILQRAGSLANRLWMVAIGLGLGGCLVGGLLPNTAKNLLGLDGYEKAGLLVLATGYERKDIVTG